MAQKGRQMQNNYSKMRYRYIWISPWIECCESGEGEGEKGTPGRGNSLSEAQSGEFPPSDKGLKEHLDVKVLGWKTATHMCQEDFIDRWDICFPRHPWLGPSFLECHSGSPANSLSVHFNKLVLQSHIGSCFMALANTIYGQRMQASSKRNLVSEQTRGNTVNLASSQRNAN